MSANSLSPQVYAITDALRVHPSADSRPLAASKEEWLARIASDATKALGGDNEAARRMADVSSESDIGGGRLIAHGSTAMPDGVVNDRLYWLRLAAERGDVLSKYMFAVDVYGLERIVVNSADAGANTNLASLRSEAIAYLGDSVNAGLADAMYLFSRSYKNSFFGLPYDAARSHAWLILLERNYPTPETSQLLAASAKSLRAGEIAIAQNLAASNSLYQTR